MRDYDIYAYRRYGGVRKNMNFCREIREFQRTTKLFANGKHIKTEKVDFTIIVFKKNNIILNRVISNYRKIIIFNGDALVKVRNCKVFYQIVTK